jgi:hypothetical protein
MYYFKALGLKLGDGSTADGAGRHQVGVSSNRKSRSWAPEEAELPDLPCVTLPEVLCKIYLNRHSTCHTVLGSIPYIVRNTSVLILIQKAGCSNRPVLSWVREAGSPSHVLLT